MRDALPRMRGAGRLAALVIGALSAVAAPGAAQTPAADPSARLEAVLPAAVAERVLATIAAARARELPAEALEHRALELAAKDVPPAKVELGVTSYADALAEGQAALRAGGVARPAGAETEAAAAALGSGVDGAQVSALARSAPSGRSLAVPLYVVASLVDRGLPADQALARVQADLAARATDTEITAHASAAATPGKPVLTGPALAETKRPGSAGRPSTLPAGAPTSVPANGGQASRPTAPPTSTPGGATPGAPAQPPSPPTPPDHP